MPFQSGLTVSGVAAFMPAVLAADWTVLELAAPVLPGLGGQHPERAIIADDRIGVHDGVGQLVLVITVPPPDNGSVDCGIIVLVDQILAGQILDLGAHRVIDVVIPQPFLHDVAGLETKFFTVL